MNSENTDPVRVLHIFGSMNRGGAEMRTVDLMRSLDRRNFALDFLALSGKSGELESTIAQLGGRTYLCPLGLRFPLQFVRILRREQYDVVHSHVYLFSGIILLLARIAGVKKRVAHFRTTGANTHSGVMRRIRDKLLVQLIRRNATSILGVSKGSIESVLGKGWQKDARCRVTYSTVDLSPFGTPIDRTSVRRELGFSEEAKIIIHVGRMDRSKNHIRLVHIFAKIAARDPSVRLVTVGRQTEPIRQEVSNAVQNLGLSDYVRLLPARHDIPRLLKSADVLLFPSIWEGLPGVVLEASIAGIPTVATDLPGICEIAEHFPTVQTLPLAVSDEVWADTCIQSFGKAMSTRRAIDLFHQSPFAASRVVQEHIAVW